MSELTREEIEGYRDICVRTLWGHQICDMALRTHDAEQRAERAEAEAANLREKLRLFLNASMSKSIPSRGESWIGWQQGDGPGADECKKRARAALQSAPPASESGGGERCPECNGRGQYSGPNGDWQLCHCRDTTRATTGERTKPMCWNDPNLPFRADPAPADRPEPSSLFQSVNTVDALLRDYVTDPSNAAVAERCMGEIWDHYHRTKGDRPEPSEALHRITWWDGRKYAESEHSISEDHKTVRRALSQPVPAVPDGWRLVPDRCNDEWAERFEQIVDSEQHDTVIDQVLAAAPTPEPSEGGTHD